MKRADDADQHGGDERHELAVNDEARDELRREIQTERGDDEVEQARA